MTLVLERTKVTGPGKRVGTLAAQVCDGARYAEPGWLRAGLRLRDEHFSNIDYTQSVPTRDLAGGRNVASDYGDTVAASLLLQNHVPDSEGHPLFPSLAGAYWAERSERNAVPTLAAAMCMQGRWAGSRRLTYGPQRRSYAKSRSGSPSGSGEGARTSSVSGRSS